MCALRSSVAFESRRRVKECTSRHSDWRFLLGDLAPRRAISFGRDALTAQTACFAETTLTPPGARARRECSLAVADSADQETLRAAWDATTDGGTCYVEVPRSIPQPLWMLRRRFLSIGYRDVRFFLARPLSAAQAPRAWIPLDRLAASFAMTPEMASTSFWRHGARSARRALRFLAAHAGIAHPIIVVAHRPRARSEGRAVAPEDTGASCVDLAGETPAILSLVRQHWDRPSLGPEPEHLSLLLTAPGERPVSKVVALVFGARRSEPRLVVKLPRSAEALASLTREAEALSLLRDRRPTVVAAPRILFAQTYPGGLVLGETYLEGVPLWQRLRPRSHAALAMKMSQWAATLVDPDLSDAAAQARTISSVIDDFQRCFAAVIDAGMLREACEEMATLGSLPTTFEQRDFSPWNILVNRSGQLAVVDWESAQPDGLPLLDLWYGLSYLAFYRTRAIWTGEYARAYRDLLDSSTESGVIATDAVAAYVASTKMPPSAVRPLRMLTWMLHGRSEYRQMAEDAGGPPSPAALRASTFVALWREEMHGAR